MLISIFFFLSTITINVIMEWRKELGILKRETELALDGL